MSKVQADNQIRFQDIENVSTEKMKKNYQKKIQMKMKFYQEVSTTRS